MGCDWGRKDPPHTLGVIPTIGPMIDDLIQSDISSLIKSGGSLRKWSHSQTSRCVWWRVVQSTPRARSCTAGSLMKRRELAWPARRCSQLWRGGWVGDGVLDSNMYTKMWSHTYRFDSHVIQISPIVGNQFTLYMMCFITRDSSATHELHLSFTVLADPSLLPLRIASTEPLRSLITVIRVSFRPGITPLPPF